MFIAQITDTHIVSETEGRTKGVDTATRLSEVIAALNGMQPAPDLVLATGDLVERGKADEYARLSALLADIDAPLYVLPGNHDERENMRAALAPYGAWAADGFCNYVIDTFPVRIIMLDSKQAGSEGGQICAGRAAWLKETLDAAPDRPTLIAMHHPPFWTRSGGFDTFGFDGLEGFHEVIRPRQNIAAIICGHVHRACNSRIGCTPVQICPSTAYSYSADLIPEFSIRKTDEPTGYAVHSWHPEGGLVSHIYWMETEAGLPAKPDMAIAP